MLSPAVRSVPFASLLLSLLPSANAQQMSVPQAPVFRSPVRLEAGAALLGQDRLYPSPVAHDVDGDGRLDLVVGDLRGRITVALRGSGDAPACYTAETPLLDAEGKEIDFHNW